MGYKLMQEFSIMSNMIPDSKAMIFFCHLTKEFLAYFVV